MASDPLSLSMATKPGLKESRKEGYLWKINKKKKRRVRKYFVLVGGSLTWTLKPTDIAPLGKIPVSSAQMRAASSYEFTITATKNGREKEYLFAGQNPEETRAWMEAISAMQSNTKSKVGWLVFGKEKKRAWFLFQKSVLYWFSKEQDLSGDFRKETQGVVKLAFYNVNVQSETTFEIQDFLPAVAPEEEPKGGVKKLAWDDIANPPPGTSRRVFTFVCKTKEELLSWVQAFQDDITKHRKRVNAGTEHFGWLKAKEKDGKSLRRLFFFLRGGRLAWYRSAEDWTECEKGSMLLEQCQVKRELSEARTLTIYNPSNASVTLTLIAERDEDFQKWMSTLEKAVETIGQKLIDVVDEVRTAAVNSRERVEMSGWLILKGKKKFFRLKADVLLYFEDEPRNGVESKLIDSIRLKDAVLTKKEFSFSIKTSDAKLFELSAHSMQEITEWIVSINAALQQARGIAYAQSKGTAVDPTLMSMFQADLGKQGWVMKEGKRRFLDLAPGRITELDTNFKPKRVVALESASVSVIDATSFLLRTVDSSHVYICPKEDTADWVKNISFYIIKSNAAAATELEKKGWLLVNGKSFWCGLKTAKFSWFPQQQLDTYQFPEKTTLNMQECKVTVLPAGASAAARFRFQVIPPTGKPVDLRADSENEMNAWLKAFASCLEAQEQARRKTAASTMKSPVFGTDLAQLLVNEKDIWRAQGANAEIPYVVRRSIEYLDQPKAYETPGLWQTGGSFPKVREWAALLNSGQDINFKDASFHDVTGLVKHFLRSLPEPVMTFSLHDPILDARSDPDKLGALIAQLPPANKALCKYLMKYLDKLTTQVLEIEEVNAVDLSMVFAPLLFRRQADPAAPSVDEVRDEDDLDLLKGVLVVGTLIHKYWEIFEGKKPTIKEALGLADEVGETGELGNEVSLSSLDALLDNFLNGNTMGLDLTDQQINRLTLKRNALRSQQKQENNMNDWAKNLKMPPARKPLPDAFLVQDPSRNSAVADLDNLMMDLDVEKKERAGTASSSSAPSTPAKTTGGARPPPKAGPAPGDTVRASAISELDDLFEEMQTEKQERYRQEMPTMAEPSKGAVAPEVNKLLTQVNNFRRESIAIRRTKADTRALVTALETLGDQEKKKKDPAPQHRVRVFSDDGIAATAWTLAVSERTTAREVVIQIGKKLPVEKEGKIMLSETDATTGNIRLVEADEVVYKLKGKLCIAVGYGYKVTRSSTAGAPERPTPAAAPATATAATPTGSRKESMPEPKKDDKDRKERDERKEKEHRKNTDEGKHSASRKGDPLAESGKTINSESLRHGKEREHKDRDHERARSRTTGADDKLRESSKGSSTLAPEQTTPRKDDKKSTKSSRRDGPVSPRSTHHTPSHTRQPSLVGPDDEFAQLASSRHKNEKTPAPATPTPVPPVPTPTPSAAATVGSLASAPQLSEAEAAAIEAEIRRNEEERARLEAEIKAHEERRRQREKEKKEKEERERKEREERERKEAEERARKEREEQDRREREEKEKRDAEERKRREEEERLKKERDEQERKAREAREAEERKKQEEEEERKKRKLEEEKRKREEEERRRRDDEEHKRKMAELQKAEEDARRRTEDEKRKREEAEARVRKAEQDLQRAREEERKRQEESTRLLKESMRAASKGSGSVFTSVASATGAAPAAGEKNELKATIGEIDALLNNAALPPTPRVPAVPPPKPAADPIKSTIGEIDALLAQPGLGPSPRLPPFPGGAAVATAAAPTPPTPKAPAPVVTSSEEVVLSIVPTPRRADVPAPAPAPTPAVAKDEFNPRAGGADEFDPRSSQRPAPPAPGAGSPATAPASAVRPEDVGCPAVLTVLVNNSPKNIAITPGLTFQQVLTAIAKSKADEYEIVSTDGLMLAGEVALSFAGKKEAKCVLQKAEVLL